MAKETKKTAAADRKMEGTDQVRSAVRFPMQLPLRIKTADGFLEATTIDISANGILFSGTSLPALNSRIVFTIAMPAAIMGSETDVTIECIGRVIRHEREGSAHLAAVIIDEYSLRN